ncbi:MAG: hypothetical protein M1826_000474 [Phylliscum demangeonii]|nr:MAG: hypothetical protein M1826_000474 [Phylliscum demangeonii]
MPLNDDAQEKAARLQSRQALHEVQFNQIRAAASPMRKLNPFARATSSSPKTPNGSAGRRPRLNEDDGSLAVNGALVSPVKRVPILANFEEWMKMATDNKINATNSWNFALIDYFHDMSLLKEGDGVNFQKASCTLDGCVKIYTSRVDSVATETGKLLSGLTENGQKKRRADDHGDGEAGDDGEEGDMEDGEEGEDGVRRRVKKRTQRSSEATLASSFAQLQLKKFDLEFSVDPLFKKASADFDEGGAKGLLLNNLAIDQHGRVVFDSSDEQQQNDDPEQSNATLETMTSDEDHDTIMGDGVDADSQDEPPSQKQSGKIDIAALRAKFFPDLALLNHQEICPSLKNSNLADPGGALDIPFLKAPSDWRQDNSQPDNDRDKSGIVLADENGPIFEDDGGDGLGGFDLPPETGFGEGGEVWSRTVALDPNMPHGRPALEGGLDKGYQDDGEELGVGAFDPQDGDYAVALDRGGTNGADQDGILMYFDDAMRSNWAGPEHWRIRRIRDMTKSAPLATKARKEKEPFEIDFLSPLDSKLAEAISVVASSAASISLPRAQWKSKTRNLLPDDKHFSSKQLIHLFIKPRARLGSWRRLHGPQPGSRPDADIPENEINEAFWARDGGPAKSADEDNVQGNYDANFFQDDGLAFPQGLPDDDDDEFADAREHQDGDPGDGNRPGAAAQEGGYGTQLVTQTRRVRPEYVQYARVAKKVDVRRLKEEMWKGMGMGLGMSSPEPEARLTPESLPPPSSLPQTDDSSWKFTDVINGLQTVYPEQAMADISTSYCFICLLHLANEKGLEIAGEEGLTELQIRKDPSAEISEDG